MRPIVVTPRSVGPGSTQSVDLLIDEEPRVLWFSVSAGTLKPSGSLADFALIAALPLAMARGRDLHVDGAVSESLLANLWEYQQAWSAWCPELFQQIAIEPRGLSGDAARPISRERIGAFSGGVDSVYALIANETDRLGPRAASVADYVMVEGFDFPLDGLSAFAAASKSAAQILGLFGARLNIVRTNWRSFCPDWERTNGAGIAAILHLLGSEVGGGRFGADQTYRAHVNDRGSNAITNHLLGSDKFCIETVGFGTTRIEKCRVLAEFPEILPKLRVCWKRPDLNTNCGRCEKCVRTKLEFLAAGADVSAAFLEPLVGSDVRVLTATNRVQLAFFEELLECRTLPSSVLDGLADVVNRARKRLAATYSA